MYLGDREQITADQQGYKGHQYNAPPHEYFVILLIEKKPGRSTADPHYEAGQRGRKWTRGGVTKVMSAPFPFALQFRAKRGATWNFNQVEWDKASDIVASEVGFKIDLNKRPRPSLFLYVRVLLSLGTRRGRECQAAGMAWGAPRNQKPDPNHQLISLWSYTVATKVENLKLAGR